MTNAIEDICRRIRHVRVEMAGPRGRARFAEMIDVPSSTYQNYETSRVPPADVLVRIAQVSGVDLRWLLTGQPGEKGPVSAEHPVIQRAAQLLSDNPDAAKPLAAFIDILAAALAFPAKPAQADTASPAAVPGEPPAERDALAPPAAALAPAPETPADWIPVLGRSAAGVPHFWSDGEEAGVRAIGDLVRRYASGEAAQRRPAVVSTDGMRADDTVQIVALSEPVGGEVAEFIAAPALKARRKDAFALRIDGESMSPDIGHGDLVILSPSVPAADGKSAVVQLRGQIGVTCKLFRREAGTVHLIPVNESFDPRTFPEKKVEWALRVIATVRTARRP